MKKWLRLLTCLLATLSTCLLINSSSRPLVFSSTHLLVLLVHLLTRQVVNLSTRLLVSSSSTPHIDKGVHLRNRRTPLSYKWIALGQTLCVIVLKGGAYVLGRRPLLARDTLPKQGWRARYLLLCRLLQ